jgi:hypothetical protein
MKLLIMRYSAASSTIPLLFRFVLNTMTCVTEIRKLEYLGQPINNNGVWFNAGSVLSVITHISYYLLIGVDYLMMFYQLYRLDNVKRLDEYD